MSFESIFEDYALSPLLGISLAAARRVDIEERGTYHKRDYTDLSLAGSWGLDRGSSTGTGRGSRRARPM